MNKKQLRKIFTSAKEEDIDAFLKVFNEYAEEYDINTKFQKAAFLAQVREEVGTNLRSVRENMNYKNTALRKIFGYFKRNPNEANKYGRTSQHRANQEAIANRAYANRLGNGNVASGDGWKFIGGGFYQLTGRANYENIGASFPKALTADELVEKITTVKYGLLSAMAFWKINNCHKCTNIDDVTRIINKHTHTYARRRGYYQEIVSIMS